MAKDSPENEGWGEGEPSPELSDDEIGAVAQRKAGSAKVVHEVIRLQGDEELDRPWQSLMFSGLAAGFSICVSLMAEAFLHQYLPNVPWARLVWSLGYTVGFVIVILGNLQLFTENTITVILPLATHPTLRNLGRLARLWSIVFLANMAGTMLVAVMMTKGGLVGEDQLASAIKVSSALLDHDAWTTLIRGLPAGFLVASIAWILPSARGGEFWIVFLITYVIAIGGFSHVVAGSGEVWLLWLSDKTSLAHAIGGFLLPSLVGNIIGGTGLFAVLAHGQVRGEIAAATSTSDR